MQIINSIKQHIHELEFMRRYAILKFRLDINLNLVVDAFYCNKGAIIFSRPFVEGLQ